MACKFATFLLTETHDTGNASHAQYMYITIFFYMYM